MSWKCYVTTLDFFLSQKIYFDQLAMYCKYERILAAVKFLGLGGHYIIQEWHFLGSEDQTVSNGHKTFWGMFFHIHTDVSAQKNILNPSQFLVHSLMQPLLCIFKIKK